MFRTISAVRVVFIFLAASVFSLSGTTGRAGVYYYDVNGNVMGSGVTSGGSYIWNTTNWTNDSNGASVTSNPGWGSGGNDAIFVAGADAGSNAFTVTLAGTLWANNITVNSGSPTIAVNGSNFVVGGTSTWNVATGSTLSVTGNSSGNWGALNMNGSALTFAGGGNVVLAGMGNGGSVTMNGAGILTIIGTASNVYAGGTTVNSGTLQFGDGTTGHDGSILNGITNNAAVVFNLFGSLTSSNSISGTGTLTKLGAGTLTLSGTNTYSGVTLISGGTLTLGNALALQNSTLDTSGAGTLSFGAFTSATFGGLTSGGNIVLTNASSAAVALSVGNNGGSTSYTNVLSGSGSLAKVGAGTLTLTGANTFAGA